MPRIPTYDSRAVLRAETLRTERLTEEAGAIRLPAESFTQETRAASQFGVTIQNIATDIIKVKADQEYAKSKIEAYKQLSQIEAEASQDDDFQNFEPKYSKRIQEVRDNISKTIRSPQAKQTFQQDFELKSNYSFYDIMASGRKRFLAYDKDLMAQETATTKERYFTASTPGEKQNARDELAQIFSRRVENKILNKAEAANLYKKELLNLDEGQVEHDILGNPVYALGELQKGKQGTYKELAEDKRIDLIKSAESRIEKIKNQQEEARSIAENQREADLIDLKIAGTLTEKQVKIERQTGAISAKFADSMIAALRNPKISQTKSDTFNKISLNILDPSKKEEDIRKELLNKNAIGELNDEDFVILNTFFRTVTKETIDKSMPKKNWLQRLFNNGNDKGLRQEKIAQMFKQYMQKVSQGDDPAKAVSEITSNFLDEHLTEESKKPDRQYAINPETKQKIYSEDGGLTWRDEKTNEVIK